MSIKDLQSIKNIGPSCAERIHKAGIENLEQMRELGAEEIFLKIFEVQGVNSLVCTCFLYTLEGAITGEKWNEIPAKRKEELKKFMKEFRKSFHG